jgi:hypothetical protein
MLPCCRLPATPVSSSATFAEDGPGIAIYMSMATGRQSDEEELRTISERAGRMAEAADDPSLPDLLAARGRGCRERGSQARRDEDSLTPDEAEAVQ